MEENTLQTKSSKNKIFVRIVDENNADIKSMVFTSRVAKCNSNFGKY
jgi:hypothetical protein